MAVAVEQAPYAVLDEDYRIVEVGSAAKAAFAPLLGRDLWECFPGSEPLFRPYYDKARRTGKPVEFVQFYDGLVARIRAVPVGRRLELSWDRIMPLDTLTLDRLRASLADAIALLGDGHAELRNHAGHGSLRVIEGGAA